MTMKINQLFEALDWHDAVLLQLNIDRQTPGKSDEVSLLIEWLDGRKQQVRFTNCYAFDAQMNFGVIAPESIRSARCIADSQKLAEIRQRWIALGVNLEDLWCFEITTNSTASEVRIYAKLFELSDL